MNDAPRAFISFLLCEAKQAEERARSLRATAATIEAKNIEGEKRIYNLVIVVSDQIEATGQILYKVWLQEYGIFNFSF